MIKLHKKMQTYRIIYADCNDNGLMRSFTTKATNAEDAVTNLFLATKLKNPTFELIKISRRTKRGFVDESIQRL